MTPCECKGMLTLGVPCGHPDVGWVAACEALLCSNCIHVGYQRCCACGAPAAGHYRLLVAEAVEA